MSFERWRPDPPAIAEPQSGSKVARAHNVKSDQPICPNCWRRLGPDGWAKGKGQTECCARPHGRSGRGM